ncbi:muellerian-inhibiting factor [Gastrophryne carolinensis]
MGVLHAMWWMLVPLLCQSFPSNTEESVTNKMKHESSEDLPHVKQDDTICGANAEQSWPSLEMHGLLREYEVGFLDLVKQEPWENQKVFGICSEEEQFSVPTPMKELATFLANPRGKQLVVMHLQTVKWEPDVSMKFQASVQDHVSPILQHLHLIIGVFYPDTPKILADQSKIMISGEEIAQPQVACMSLETRYLVLKLKGTVKSAESGNLKLHLSFQIKLHPAGLSLSTTEARRHLFGTDEKCSTKVTPVILMLVGHHAHSGISPSNLQSDIVKSFSSTEDNKMLATSKKGDEFTENLSHFATLLMMANGKASSTIYINLGPKNDDFGDLQPQPYNVTEVEALEWLVESQEPVVFHFSPGSKNLLANRVEARLNGTLLENITDKMQEVLEDLKELLASSKHARALQKLLNSCYGNFNISYLQEEENTSQQLREGHHRKLHSLMLLKTLQTIRTDWKDRKILSRQNRGAGLKPHCRLQELTVSFYAEYEHIYFPKDININNCVGPCIFPQTTQAGYQTHVNLLIKLQERTQPGIGRPPCCVPVRYEGQWLMVTDENGMKLEKYPNMIAKECGCR